MDIRIPIVAATAVALVCFWLLYAQLIDTHSTYGVKSLFSNDMTVVMAAVQ
jgi:hypothetical protein